MIKDNSEVSATRIGNVSYGHEVQSLSSPSASSSSPAVVSALSSLR